MITLAAHILTAVVALLHYTFLWLEMCAWDSIGKKVFRALPIDLFAATKPLAANQGLYNGFLAAGLSWSFFIQDLLWRDNVRFFFLLCVIVAGIYGALSVSRRIFFVQALPAILALLLVLLD